MASHWVTLGVKKGVKKGVKLKLIASLHLVVYQQIPTNAGNCHSSLSGFMWRWLAGVSRQRGADMFDTR